MNVCKFSAIVHSSVQAQKPEKQGWLRHRDGNRFQKRFMFRFGFFKTNKIQEKNELLKL